MRRRLNSDFSFAISHASYILAAFILVCVSLCLSSFSYTCLHRLLYHIGWDISVLGRTLIFSQLLAVLVSDRTASLAPEYKLLNLKKKKKKVPERLS